MSRKFLFTILFLSVFMLFSQENIIKALVGGTLIDGFISTPVINSIVIIEGDKIKTVGTLTDTPIPENAEVISVEGLTVNYEYMRDNPEKLDNGSWHRGLPDSVVTAIKKSIEHPDRTNWMFGSTNSV